MYKVISNTNVSKERIASWVRQANGGVLYLKVTHGWQVAELKHGEYLVNNEP